MQRHQVGSDGAERIGRLELFEGLSRGQLLMVARLLDEVIADAGETLVREGEPGYELFVIEEGTADVLQAGEPVNRMGPGDNFGELALLEVGGTRTATVVASTPLRAVLLSAHFVREMQRAIPLVAERIEAIGAARAQRDRDRDRAAP